MLPIRWDPFRDLGREMSGLHREMDDLFRRFFGETRGPALETGVMFAPPLNTFVKDRIFHVQVEIPGVNKNDLEVNVEGKQLTIRGERKMRKEVKEQDFQTIESRYGTFFRRVALPEGVNTNNVHARYEEGVLEITLPVEKQLEGRKVLIEGPEEGRKPKEIH